MVLPLTFAGNPILYKKCKEIPPKEIQSAKVQTFLNNLGETVTHFRHAAGLAAPQVGKDWRIFCLELDKKSMNYDVITPRNFEIPSNKPFFYINPVLEFPNPATDEMGEGCLSIPYYHVYVERFLTAKVSAYTKEGVYFEILAKGLFARYIQHEVDHLNGILLFQRAKHIEDIVFDTEEAE
ncbi:MAG: peptide deformylase [Patescibacteria group bacterium]|jgi:peptide deformylase